MRDSTIMIYYTYQAFVVVLSCILHLVRLVPKLPQFPNIRPICIEEETIRQDSQKL